MVLSFTYTLNYQQNTDGMSDKSIPTTIPCHDSKPSCQWTRAALTAYIINRRWVAMESLEQIRDKAIPKAVPWSDSQPSYQGVALHLHTILSTEDR